MCLITGCVTSSSEPLHDGDKLFHDDPVVAANPWNRKKADAAVRDLNLRTMPFSRKLLTHRSSASASRRDGLATFETALDSEWGIPSVRVNRVKGVKDNNALSTSMLETKAGNGARYVTDPGSKVALATLRVEDTPNNPCEVCMYALENKNNNQPFLCRDIRHPKYQQDCVNVLVSMMWWLQSTTYWIHFGCFQNMGATSGNGKSNDWRWVKPCPPHAVCSWIKNIYDQQPFCPPADDSFAKPKA